ncbi:MAG: 50S ribosomal protein L1 [Flavobacteriales bacterium AspAUS03]
MAKLTKKQKIVYQKFDRTKQYTLEQASKLVKEITLIQFNASIDLAVRLGVDPRKPNQMVRGVVTLPNGNGKEVCILALLTSDKEIEAQEAGANYVGLEEYLEKIKNGWLDFDVIVTMPAVMAKLGPLGKILGPRGLMPNPKIGTVTMEPGKAVREIKSGKINFKVDRYGIVHACIGKSFFTPEQLESNATELIHTLHRLKPSAAKGIYMKSIYLSSTMSPGIAVDPKSV